MKSAFVLISLLAALVAAQAAPSPAAASLGLAPVDSAPQGQATQVAFGTSAEPTAAPAGRSLSSANLPQESTADPEGPNSAIESALVLLAAGTLALLAVARRRSSR